MGSNFLKSLHAEFHQCLNMYLTHNSHRCIYYLTEVACFQREFIIMESNFIYNILHAKFHEFFNLYVMVKILLCAFIRISNLKQI